MSPDDIKYCAFYHSAICADSRVVKGISFIYIIKTVLRGTWVRYRSREDSGVAHGFVSLGTEVAKCRMKMWVSPHVLIYLWRWQMKCLNKIFIEIEIRGSKVLWSPSFTNIFRWILLQNYKNRYSTNASNKWENFPKLRNRLYETNTLWLVVPPKIIWQLILTIWFLSLW